jgi:pimeloyl-ACP methyl ester carboxylesterase
MAITKPKPDSPFFDKIVQKEVAVPKVYASINAEGYTNLRYDLILLVMLDEVSLLWPAIDTSKVLLTWFSGGGQFVHGFTYLHPERLPAVNVSGPGSVSSPSFSAPPRSSRSSG